MRKIYLAGPWADRAEVSVIADTLTKAGFTITREWWKFEAGDEEHDKLGLLAKDDINAIMFADAMVVVNNLSKSEGKAFEQGIAWSIGIPIVVVGPPSMIFHHMPEITLVRTVEEAINELRQL